MQRAFTDLRQRELLRLIVHELRNPLSAALYSTELLNRNLSKIPGMPDAVPSTVGNVRAAIFAIEAVLGNVGRYARAASLTETTGTPRQLLQWWAKSTNVPADAFTIEFGENSDKKFVGHLDRVAACVDALVRNAIDAHQRHQQVSPIKIVVGAGENPEDIVISVIDNGDGVDETIAPRLFEPFTTTCLETNIGLGLCLAKSIVTEYGARIKLVRHRGPTQFDLVLVAR